MALLNGVVDTVGLFYLFLFFAIATAICRNSTFQSYAKSFYKNYLSFSNILPLFNYVSFFFNSFLKSISFLVNKVFYFFKKRK